MWWEGQGVRKAGGESQTIGEHLRVIRNRQMSS